MYEKRLFNRRVLRFLYAPPFTKLDDVSEDEKPQAPYRDAPYYMRSVYYYWWAFLRENNEYIACCNNGGKGEHARLYEDFGDVREDDFFKWWRQTGRELFCERDMDKIQVFLSAGSAEDKPKHVLMSVPIKKDMEHLVAEFRQLIKPLYQRQRRDDTVSTAKYPVHTRPVIAALHIRLMIYQARKANPKDEMTLSEIGTLVGAGGGEIAISRYYKESQRLVRNVVLGRFPDMK